MNIRLDKINYKHILLLVVILAVIIMLNNRIAAQRKKIATDRINERISKLIPEINNLTVNFLDGKAVIEKKVKTVNCEYVKSCIKIKNDYKEWLSPVNSDVAIPIDNFYLVKMALKNDGGTSGVNFIGGFSTQEKDWWDGLLQISTYLDYDKLKINLYDGTNQIPQELYYEPIKIDDLGYAKFYLLVDSKGKNINLYGEEGNLISRFDIATISKNKLKDGIFPDNNIFLGLSVAPESSLDISELYGFDTSFLK